MWYCDSCGGEIDRVEDGWLEWINSTDVDKIRYSGLRLVHHNEGCKYNEIKMCKGTNNIISNNHLMYFVGDNGLMRLLQYLQEDYFLDQGEVYEMIKRLHIDGYEQARRFIDQAYYEGIIDGHERDYSLLYQSTIKTINKNSNFEL